MEGTQSMISDLPQMEENVVNNIEHRTNERNSNVNNQTLESSIQNQSNLEETGRVIVRRKPKPMRPTPLEYSWWSTHQRERDRGAIGLFLITATLIGVLIVCLTTKKTIAKCELNFKKTAQNPVQYNYGPRSIAIGDFNDDAWPDIVVANNIANNIVIYLGSSHGSFIEQPPYSSGLDSNPNVVAVGDINNDYCLDIIVANFGTHNIGIFLGLGNATFLGMIEISTTTSRPIAICLTDFNNDTFLDIVTANYGTHSVSIFYGYGNESFSNPITFSTGYDSYPSSAATGDFNNDNYLDVVIANYGTDNVGLFLGNNKSIISVDQLIFSTGRGSRPISIAVGYLNDDILLDIAIAQSGNNQIGILLNNGNGDLEYQMIYSIDPACPQSIGIADFNQDKRLDIVVTNKGTNNIGVFLGYENGTFENARMYATGSISSISFATGDLNRDNRLDLTVVSNDTGVIDILLGYFEGFPNFTKYSIDSKPCSVAVGDFNNDTHLDIVAANFGSDHVNVLLGYGDGSFANQTTYSTGVGPQSVAVGDFNNDTHLDIVVANYFDNDVSVLLGYGDGSFANQTTYSTGSWPQSVAVGDFNNDTHLDIVVANSVSNNVSILLGYGDGSFANQTTYSTGHAPISVAVDDFNNDTHLDIVVVNFGSENVSVLLGYGDGSFANQTTYSVGVNPDSVAVGDFNHDTHLDIVVVNSNYNNISVLLGYGDGSFVNQITYSTGSWPQSVAVGDFNNDTHLDIVVADLDSSSVTVFFGCFNTVFRYQMVLSNASGSQPSSFVIDDFNNDDRMDVAVVYSSMHNIGIFLGYGNISFEEEESFPIGFGSSSYSIAAGDFNNDTFLDMVIVSSGSNNIGIFLGYGNGSFTKQTTYLTDSSLLSVAVSDFNNDLILDIIVALYDTNNIGVLLGYGNGTFANAVLIKLDYNSHPFLVLVADFNNDRKLDFAVANDATDSIQVFLQTC